MPLQVEFDNSYSRLPERFYARLDPRPVAQPELIALNDELARNLNLDPEFLGSPEGVSALAGNSVLEGSAPIAMAYAGQQFGNWVPQLGDGRALLLGEVIDHEGKRRDIQLKGSGPTPFSRMGDGRAWLGPVLREYIVSEAMAALGIPTTRALAAVSTGEMVYREKALPGAVLTRVATSHIRVGTFQYFVARRDQDGLAELADYTIERLYPDLKSSESPVLGLLGAVIAGQAHLVAKWMNIGFIHGVMNTDNVSIAGETIDYGPCAFMDDFHPDRVFSSIDQTGRYAYSNQPRIAHWNLVQFAQAILPLLGETEEQAVERAQQAVNVFPDLYNEAWQKGFNAKLGLSQVREGDSELGNELLKLMSESQVDFTNAFRQLAGENSDGFKALFSPSTEIEDWLERRSSRLQSDHQTAEQRHCLMEKVNPAFIPRNHRVEQAISGALSGDYQPFERLLRVLKNPHEDQPGEDDLKAPPAPEEVVPYTFCGT